MGKKHAALEMSSQKKRRSKKDESESESESGSDEEDEDTESDSEEGSEVELDVGDMGSDDEKILGPDGGPLPTTKATVRPFLTRLANDTSLTLQEKLGVVDDLRRADAVFPESYEAARKKLVAARAKCKPEPSPSSVTKASARRDQGSGSEGEDEGDEGSISEEDEEGGSSREGDSDEASGAEETKDEAVRKQPRGSSSPEPEDKLSRSLLPTNAQRKSVVAPDAIYKG